MVFVHRHHTNTDLQNLLDSLPEFVEMLNLRRVASQSLGDSSVRPAESLAGFQRHQAVIRIGKHVT